MSSSKSQNAQHRPLSLRERHFRRQVLRQYRCPFREVKRGCRREDNPNECFFAHPNTPGLSGEQLIDLPSYVCVYNLINSCYFSIINKPKDNACNTVPVCSAGCFHLSMFDLIDLEKFETNNCELIASQVASDGERECAICLERIHSKRLIYDRSFGILESCMHTFCAFCITSWQAQDRNRQVTCPICRVVSSKVAISAQFTDDPDVKKAIFEKIKRSCARV